MLGQKGTIQAANCQSTPRNVHIRHAEMETQRPRRQFLKALGAGAAGLATAGYTATSRGYPANETLNIACIGTGGRCRHLMGRLNRIEGVRTVAVCDVWDVHLEAGRRLALRFQVRCTFLTRPNWPERMIS